ncbi:hypothetical protein LPJ72_006156, partial [Coemansia sp. Benny D160-2]
MLVCRDDDDDVHGMLIDFDHAINIDAKEQLIHAERTGTLQFMSVNNLAKSHPQQTALDDWESMLYILCWAGTYGWSSQTRRDNTGRLRQPTQLKSWYIGSSHEELAEAKRNILHNEDAFSQVIMQFNYGLQDIMVLIKLVMQLRRVLIETYDDDRRGAIEKKGFRLNPETNEPEYVIVSDPFEKRSAMWEELSPLLLQTLEESAQQAVCAKWLLPSEDDEKSRSELSSCQSLEEAAQPFWGYTGNSRIISAITLKNKDIVGRLAFHLIREYKDNTLPASHIVATRHRQHNPDVAISESVQHVTLCANSLPDRPDFSDCTLNELVTLFLYTGYLTLRDSVTLKIPDGELLDAWEDIQLTAIFSSENTVAWDNERDALLQSLCDGDMRDISSQFNSVLQQLSNASRNAHEAASADLFRAFILAKMGTTSHSRAVSDGARGSRQMEPISIVEGE